MATASFEASARPVPEVLEYEFLGESRVKARGRRCALKKLEPAQHQPASCFSFFSFGNRSRRRALLKLGPDELTVR
jgi:hypothetical protein